MDLLAEVLTVSGVQSTVGARIDGADDWGWWAADAPGAAVHAVTSGTAWLSMAGRPALQLMPGDVVLLPRGSAHVLASDRDAAARTGPRSFDGYEQTATGVVRIGSGPVRTHVLCAHYEHDPAVSLQVLDLLPDLVHLSAEHSGDGLDDTIRLLARELARPQIASAVVLNSLVDILLVQLLRAWLPARPDATAPSWLGVLTDPVVGAAVAALHDDPGRDWTSAALAREVSVSRATLERRFRAIVGTSPSAYLTRWRMDLAARRLRDTDDALESIARSVGYASVYAFSRAFRRACSQPPGRYRVASRARLREAAQRAAAA